MRPRSTRKSPMASVALSLWCSPSPNTTTSDPQREAVSEAPPSPASHADSEPAKQQDAAPRKSLAQLDRIALCKSAHLIRIKHAGDCVGLRGRRTSRPTRGLTQRSNTPHPHRTNPHRDKGHNSGGLLFDEASPTHTARWHCTSLLATHLLRCWLNQNLVHGK